MTDTRWEGAERGLSSEAVEINGTADMKKGSVGEQDLACALSESQGQTPSELADERRGAFTGPASMPWRL